MGFTEQCLKNIDDEGPPDNVPCTANFCSQIQQSIAKHCRNKGLSPDTPLPELDPNLYGPGKSGFCYCCCSCFAHDTPLEASPGTFVLVQDVHAQDLLMAASIAQGGNLTWAQKPVELASGVFQDPGGPLLGGMYTVAYKYADGEEQSRFVVVTADHLFLMADGTLKPVQALGNGELLRRADNGTSEIDFVVYGSTTKGMYSIQMGPFDGKNLDGHLLNTNGIVTSDYAVQVWYASNQLAPALLHASANDPNTPIVGTAEHAAKYPSKARDAFIANPDAWPRGFVPQVQREIVPPPQAHSFLTRAQANDVRTNAPHGGVNNTYPADAVLYLFSLVRGMYPNVTVLLDWTNETPNAYSWSEWGRQMVVVTGGLARIDGLRREGLSLIVAAMVAYTESDIECVGTADYAGVSSVMRTMWTGNLYGTNAKAALDQIRALFAWVSPAHSHENPNNICRQPSLACRLETYTEALSMLPIPECAVPHPHTFFVLRAAQTAADTVTVYFNAAVDPATAQTAENYAFLPGLAVKAAAVTNTSAKAVALTVDGLAAKTRYMVTVTGVLSRKDKPLDPAHDTVIFTSK